MPPTHIPQLDESIEDYDLWFLKWPGTSFSRKLQTTPAPLGAPFVDHQHHTRAEGLKARSRWFLHETAPKLVDLSSTGYSQRFQTVASRLGAKN